MRRLLHLARRAFPSTLGDRRGVALVLTLLVVVLLTAMILDFDFRTRLDVRAAANFRDDTRAYLLASSAVAAARVVLQEDKDHGTDWINDDWATIPEVPMPVADGTISIKIEDEAGKLDVNGFIRRDAQPQEPEPRRVEAYRRLLEDVLQDVEDVDVDALVDALLDWLDDDDHPRAGGDESSYYGSLEPPYAARNGPLKGFDELGLVKGYTPEILELLRPHVTALWLPGTTDQTTWHPPVNINTASEEVIASLDPNLADALDGIVADRKNQPFKSCGDVGSVIKLLPEQLKNLCKVLQWKSDYFSVRASGRVGETVRTVRTTLFRRGNKTDVLAWRME